MYFIYCLEIWSWMFSTLFQVGFIGFLLQREFLLICQVAIIVCFQFPLSGKCQCQFKAYSAVAAVMGYGP